MEEWRTIEGYDSRYQISNYGKVKSFSTIKHGNLMVISTDNKGYLYVNLSKNKKWKRCKIHKLVASAFLENTYNMTEINHIDRDKTNNHVSNLEFCTRSQNMKHVFKDMACGHPTETLFTEDQVIEIYKLTHERGIKIKDVASKFNANYSTIRNIKNGYSWKNTTEKIIL